MFSGIPWYSTFTLATETTVTVCIFYVFYRAYVHNRFPHLLAGVVLAYEVLFNISYMASRIMSHVDTAVHFESSFDVGLAIFHGIFSLLMFILLLVFLFIAWRAYDRGINYFQLHKKLTAAFLIAWMVAICSGFLFYYETYFGPDDVSPSSDMAATTGQG